MDADRGPGTEMRATSPRTGGQPDREQAGPAIIVPLDGSERSLAALPVARGLAALEDATIHVVNVDERVVPPAELLARLRLSPRDMEGVVVDELAASSPSEGILRLAAELPSPRIVLNAHSESVGPGRELGPVAEAVLESADCPIVLVRPERGTGPWTLRRMLLPHDGSPLTASAFNDAVEIARHADASLFVLHVATLVGEPAPGTVPVPTYVDQPQHEWPEWSREFLERMEIFCCMPEEMHPRLFLSRGDPGEEVLRFAREHDIDLVALAWHGHFGLSRAATAREVILHSPCPVLFLRVDESALWERIPPPMRQRPPAPAATWTHPGPH